MKRLIFLLFFLFLIHPKVYAKYDPREVANNKFGIHIVDPNDIPDAAALVNSSGGDWGYVTFVIQESERSVEKWQPVFDQLRRLRLIPIVRLATKLEGSIWVKPQIESIDLWVKFLNGIKWPIENRYIILFNEPNHAKEWGNTLNPEGYGAIVVELSKKLKAANEDFFILPAGLDASAGNGNGTLDAYNYLARVINANPEFLTSIDGWTSHSYPNPGFSAPAVNRGRGSLTTYQWEIDTLHQLGSNRDLPVFITETGWIHSSGVTPEPSYLSPDAVSINIKIAADTVWKDKNIIAVTPFLLNYQGEPFDHFSWKKLGENDYFPQYSVYQSISKTKGKPRQRLHFEFTTRFIPPNLVAGSKYTIQGTINNEGQGILSWRDIYELEVRDSQNKFVAFVEPLPTVEPGHEGNIFVHLETPPEEGTYNLTVKLKHNGSILVLEENTVTLIPPPSIMIYAKLGLKFSHNANDVTVLVYDSDELLLHKFTDIQIKGGISNIKGLTNVIPANKYRIVMLVPYYLPRQSVVELSPAETKIKMKRLLPFDFNRDGKFSLSDIQALFKLSPGIIFDLICGS